MSTPSSDSFEEQLKEIVIAHDFADAGQDKYYIQDVLERINIAHNQAKTDAVVEALEELRLEFLDAEFGANGGEVKRIEQAIKEARGE